MRAEFGTELSHHHNTQHLLLGSKVAPECSLRRRGSGGCGSGPYGGSRMVNPTLPPFWVSGRS
jgi:hypothetical protein